MKQNILAIVSTITFLGLSDGALAEKIVCKAKSGDEAVFTRISDEELAKRHLTGPDYQVTIDEAISSGYLGEVSPDENRWVSFDKKASSSDLAVINDWNGNSGIAISFPRSVAFNPTAGKTFKTQLTVTYSDIAEDEVTTDVTCTVTVK